MQFQAALVQNQSQALLVTPQFQQALKVLHSSAAELEDLIEKELKDNPALEAEESDIPNLSRELPTPREHREELELQVSSPVSLLSHLSSQLNELDLPLSQRRIASFIIGNLDEDGYLGLREQEIGEALMCSPAEVAQAIEVVQSLEPKGIAARNLIECLLLQLEYQGKQGGLEARILQLHQVRLERGHLEEIAHAEQVELRQVNEAIHNIQYLNPFPGRILQEEKTEFATPDIVVKKIGGQFTVLPTGDGLPRLRVSSYFQNILSGERKLERHARAFVSSRVRAARWFVRCIYQREQTLRKIAESIVKYQHKFLEGGIDSLRALSMKEIAAETKMHESTISRAIANKYMSTPRGTFALRYFFSSGIRAVSGSVSSRTVKEKIRTIVNQESPASPLSDQRLADILKSMNITIARRTVTKYREHLGIATATSRKRAPEVLARVAI